MTGGEAITTRTQHLIDEADEEVALVIGNDSFLGAQLAECLQAAHERGVTAIVGTISTELRAHIEDVLPEVHVFVSEHHLAGRLVAYLDVLPTPRAGHPVAVTARRPRRPPPSRWPPPRVRPRRRSRRLTAGVAVEG